MNLPAPPSRNPSSASARRQTHQPGSELQVSDRSYRVNTRSRVCSCTHTNNPCTNTHTPRLVLSDGDYYVRAVPIQGLHHLITEGKLNVHSIVKLVSFNWRKMVDPNRSPVCSAHTQGPPTPRPTRPQDRTSFVSGCFSPFTKLRCRTMGHTWSESVTQSTSSRSLPVRLSP
jgi:hypothetical protein